MSKQGVSLSINVSKIDKSKLYEGKKGKYLDCTVFVDTTTDQYGNNGMITQSVSKEDKAAGKKGEILGNCKIFWSDSGSTDFNQDTTGSSAAPTGSDDDFEDQIPF